MSNNTSILADIQALESKVKEVVADVAVKAYLQVCSASPSPGHSEGGFSEGAYILSHNVTYDGIPNEFHVVNDTESPGISYPDAWQQALSAAKYIDSRNVTLGVDVIINNGTSYADIVEFIGDTQKDTGWRITRPYFTYGKAYETAKSYAAIRGQSL